MAEIKKKISAKETRPSFDRVASIFAVTLSLAAMLVSILEVATVRDQQRAAVWPYVQISSSYTDAGFALNLINKGVGPALMADVAITYDGVRVDDLDTLIADTLGPDDAFSYDVYSTSNPKSGVVAKGETVRLFGVPWEPRTQKLMTLWSDRVDVTACYCSINDDCWKTSLTSSSAEPVNAYKL